MSITVRLRNFVGVRRADLVAAPLALVVGQNHSGKSSLLQGIAATVCNAPLLRSVSKKGEATLLVREGAEYALASIAGPDGQVQMRWPDCEVTTEGRAPRGNPYAVGLLSVCDLSDKERAKVLVDLLKAEPTMDDLQRALEEAEVQEASIAKLKEIVDEQGFDVALKKAEESGTKLKGQWEQITGEKRYGSKKADGWAPTGWEPLDDLPDNVEELDEMIAALEVQVEQATVAAAATGGELKQVKEQLEGERKVAGGLDGLKQRKAEMEAQLDEAVEKRRALRNPDTDNSSPCPHCGKPILARQLNAATWSFEKPPAAEEMSEVQRKELRTAIAGLEGTKERLTAELRALSIEITQAEAAGRAVIRLEGRVKELEAIEKVAPRDAEKVKLQLHQVKEYREGLHKKQRAATIARSIASNARIQEVLRPEGLRQEKLTKALDILNGDMAELAHSAKTAAPAIGADLAITFRGRPYFLCSESEQWRGRAIIQLALARRGHADLMVLDRFDVIQPQDQGGIIEMLAEAEIPTVIGMMRKDRAAAEAVDLARAGMGATYWMEAGELEPVSEMKEAA